jgi:hypothetical protein
VGGKHSRQEPYEQLVNSCSERLQYLRANILFSTLQRGREEDGSKEKDDTEEEEKEPTTEDELLRDREDADIVFKDEEEEEEEEEEERGTSVGTEDPLQLPGSLPQTPRYGTVFVKNCWFILRSSAADS